MSYAPELRKAAIRCHEPCQHRRDKLARIADGAPGGALSKAGYKAYTTDGCPRVVWSYGRVGTSW